MLLPAAGNVQGANGTFFRTDVNLINLGAADQRVALYWLPEGRAGSSTPKILKIDRRSGIFSADFVANVLEQTGLGSIRIIAIDAGGAEDPTAQLHASVRIWTPEPNVPTGTMSQTFPTVVMTSASFSSIKYIFGVRRDAQYRMNVGISNADSTTRRFRVTATPSSDPAASEVFDVEVPPRAMVQRLVPGTSTGSFQITIVNLDEPANTTTYQAWASSIDNVTGDAFSQIAFPAN
jgi:hypothetical protein